MTRHSKRLKYSAALVLVAAAIFALGSLRVRDERPQASTSFQWRGIQDWGLGWKRVAYCSEQSAAFRGWKAELGPLAVLHLKSTFPVPRIVEPNVEANRSQSARPATNQTSVAADSGR